MSDTGGFSGTWRSPDPSWQKPDAIAGMGRPAPRPFACLSRICWPYSAAILLRDRADLVGLSFGVWGGGLTSHDTAIRIPFTNIISPLPATNNRQWLRTVCELADGGRRDGAFGLHTRGKRLFPSRRVRGPCGDEDHPDGDGLWLADTGKSSQSAGRSSS